MEEKYSVHAREKVISIKLSVDSSHHLAPWTWKQASPEPHSP